MKPLLAAELTSGWISGPVGLMGLMAVLSLLPFAVLMLTSFSKIAVVLSLARSAIGVQQAPPSIVLTGLAAILSGHVMAPVGERMVEAGQAAYRENIPQGAWTAAAGQVLHPLREFLLKHGSAEERSRFVSYARELRGDRPELVQEGDWFVVIPAFVVTELKEAFQIGFLVFLPFLVLDMVVANVLLALGMQTLSPTQVSLAFKILLFVAVDGWSLLSRGLILGYR
jgi:type III secretion protein R